jgi:hypothetical protein
MRKNRAFFSALLLASISVTNTFFQPVPLLLRLRRPDCPPNVGRAVQGFRESSVLDNFGQHDNLVGTAMHRCRERVSFTTMSSKRSALNTEARLRPPERSYGRQRQDSQLIICIFDACKALANFKLPFTFRARFPCLNSTPDTVLHSAVTANQARTPRRSRSVRSPEVTMHVC